MTPEYLEELAEIADPDQLWKLSGLRQMELPPEKRRQLDTAVALRRYASHRRELNRLMELGLSMLITPLERHSSAMKSVETPTDHERLRPRPRASS